MGGIVREPGWLSLWLSHPPPTPSLSHISKKFARTSEETCSRNSSRGESGAHAGAEGVL